MIFYRISDHYFFPFYISMGCIFLPLDPSIISKTLPHRINPSDSTLELGNTYDLVFLDISKIMGRAKGLSV